VCRFPSRLSSDLPVRLDPDGKVEVALRPGSHRVELEAIWFSPPARLSAPVDSAPWPEAEIWSFVDASSQRTVELVGGVPVDGGQAGVGRDISSLPARRLASGESMEFKEVLRGDPRTDSVQVGCQREVWVDFSGAGLTFRDKLNLQLNRPLRLSVRSPYRLGSAVHRSAGIVLTSLREGEQGFPVEGEGNIQLVSRAEGGLWKALPVSPVGWPLDETSLAIHLGPGWRLVAVPGSTLAEGTWMGDWDLWKIFVVVLVVSLVFRLVSQGAGALSMVGLVLGCHDGVPFLAWIAFLVALALYRGIQDRWPDQVAARIAGLALGILSVVLVAVQLVFLGSQLRLVAHPELSVPGRQFTSRWRPAAMDRMEEASMEVSSKRSSGNVDGLQGLLQSSPKLYRQNGVLEKDVMPDRLSDVRMPEPTFNLQDEDPTLFSGVGPGPGVPEWEWEAGTARWTGFVRAEQTFRILALGPDAMRLWRILAVLATTLAVGMCLRRAFSDANPRWGAWFSPRLVAPLLVLLAAGAPRAEIPSAEVLHQLREELLKSDVCGEDCASLGASRLRMDGDRAVLEIEVQAHTKGVVFLPRPQWLQVSIQVPRGILGGGGESELAWVEPGFQTIRMEGIVGTEEFLVRFPEAITGVEVSANGWTVVSANQNGIHLQRKAVQASGGDSTRSDAQRRIADPPSVRRQFQFAREWTVTTAVSRRGTAGSVAVSVPLLDGESPLDPVVQREGKVQAVIPSGTEVIQWKSRLPIKPRLLLRAGIPGVASERWIVQSSVRWHLVHRGLPPVQASTLEWAPRPGDSLEILFQSPKPVTGPGVLVESSGLRLSGDDLSECRLDLRVATAVGDSFRIALPPKANLRVLELGASAIPPTFDAQGRLRLELRPGDKTVRVVWVGEPNDGVFRKAPEVVLSAAGVDARVEFPQTEQGWIVALGGPGDGPSVLWWGVVAALAVVSWLLARLPGKPLGFWSWFLLMFATSTVGNWLVLPFVAWVAAIVARRRIRPESLSKEVFNLLQVGLGALSLLAFGVLLSAIPVGLLGNPDSGVAGGEGGLVWYLDRFSGELPRPWMVVVPLMAWKAMLLCWSLWLVRSLMRWVPWGWESFTSGGIWRSPEPRPPSPGKGGSPSPENPGE